MSDARTAAQSPQTSTPRSPSAPLEIVVLVSGSGTLLQALIDNDQHGRAYTIAAVGADGECAGLERATRAGIETFTVQLKHFTDRASWDAALADAISRYLPDNPSVSDDEAHAATSDGLVVSAGFMKILGPTVLGRHTVINTHPALLPSFPGAHGVRDALAHGVKITGTTCHFVDAGVDTGPIIAQRAARIRPDDNEETLHERIKVEERAMLCDVVTKLAHGWSINGRTVQFHE